MNKGKICWYSYIAFAGVFSLTFIFDFRNLESMYSNVFLVALAVPIVLIYFFSPREKEEIEEACAWMRSTRVGKLAQAFDSTTFGQIIRRLLLHGPQAKGEK